MKEKIINQIAKELNIRENQVIKTLELLENKNTIPFISRYRKEVTGNLDEEQIRKISEVYEYGVQLLKRKQDVIRLIKEKDMLTDDLSYKIMSAEKLVEVEDLYRPFKEKKKTKATEAIANGLEPFAKYILEFPLKLEGVENYINENIKTTDEAIQGASYIIAENISDNALYRKWIRTNIWLNANIESSKKKTAEDLYKTYEMYYKYSEALKNIKPHRVLALNRGESEGVLSVKIKEEKEKIFEYLENKLIKNKESQSCNIIVNAIKDSYKRLIFPSIEREIRSEIKETAEIQAIDIFSKNLEKLLLQPPMKNKKILGLDPAYRTGCKLAVVDITGKMETIAVIYPHEPKNEIQKSKKVILDMIEKYDINIIAIGNGTASRESEAFVAQVIKLAKKPVKYIIVNEAGASVYSASKLAIEEFPNLHVEERSAISIARRLQDPLSELVKIDSKSIGVGQYQHDVNEKKLDESLDFVVSKAVNKVGVNVNTASRALLKYVSGMNKKTIDSILDYRDDKGYIKNRIEVKKIKGLTKKVYEQAIGFIRIMESDNKLDKTGIHTESYPVAEKLLKIIDIKNEDIGTDIAKEKLENVNIKETAKLLDTDEYTLDDIVKYLIAPSRDPRDDFEAPLLKSDILSIDNLKKGMKLQGTVRNVVDFGVFIDIGIKNDGLAHISKLVNRYIKHPLEVVSVGDIVDCYVEDIFLDKNKVSLTLIEPVPINI